MLITVSQSVGRLKFLVLSEQLGLKNDMKEKILSFFMPQLAKS